MPATLRSTPTSRLSRHFYRRPADVLALALLGKRLVHGERAGVIVETEAYLGPEDLASHARFGVTARNRVMFGPGGISYVYLCYGMYEMFNVVSGNDGEPGAVLIRALELEGEPGSDMARARGPGKLTCALGLTRAHSGRDLITDERLTITQGRRIARAAITRGPRIGVAYAGAWARAPLRFWIDDHPAVSRVPARQPRQPRQPLRKEDERSEAPERRSQPLRKESERSEAPERRSQKAQ